jgi:hypothetical protein
VYFYNYHRSPNKATAQVIFGVHMVDDDADRSFLRTAFERAGVAPVLALSSAQIVFTYLLAK